LIYNYDLSASQRTDKYEDLTAEEAFEKLKVIDPATALRIGNNQKRLVRALQVVEEGKSLTNKKEKQYDFITICAEKEREDVYEKINETVDEFIKNG
jgi:tRNA dimethylallyltransferase